LKIEELLKVANEHLGSSDDELAELVATKLAETFDPALADEKQLDAAIRALGCVQMEIRGAIRALGERYSQLEK